MVAVLHAPPGVLHRALALVQLLARQPDGVGEARRQLRAHAALALSRHRGGHKHVLTAPAGAVHARRPGRVIGLVRCRLLAAAAAVIAAAGGLSGGGQGAARAEAGGQQALQALTQRGAAQVVGQLTKLVLAQARLRRWGWATR